jgi:hypothetical protein
MLADHPRENTSGADVLRQLQSLWLRHRRWLLPTLVALMTIAAALKLEYQFRRLLWVPGRNGATDLQLFQRAIAEWFSGKPLTQMTYPPASYVMLWPLLGWLSLTPARWFWAATSVVAVATTVLMTLRLSGAKTNWERWFVALLLLSISGTAVTIGNAQVILHILPALLAALLMLEPEHRGLSEDIIAAALLTWVLLKPSVTAPFLWIFLFRWKHWRPVLLVFVIYAVLTLVAAAFRNESLPVLFETFFRTAYLIVIRFPGTRNVHALLCDVGLEKWISLASGVIFAALGVWTFFYRHADRWILVGVAALVARMWTYHLVYDDVLIFLPELALFRIAKQSLSSSERTVAGLLLGLTALAMLCPGWLLEEPQPRSWIWNSSHVILWSAVLLYLVRFASTSRANLSKTSV